MAIIETENVLRKLREAVKVRGSLTQVADDLDVSLSYLSKVLAGRQEPGEKILEGIGFTKLVLYVPEADANKVKIVAAELACQPWPRSVAEYVERSKVGEAA